MTKDINSILEDIRYYSSPGFKDERSSIVDIILDANWGTVEDLVAAHELMDKVEEQGSFAVTFFQLPFPMRLPSKWIHLKDGSLEHPLMNCRTFECAPQTDPTVLEIDRKTAGQIKQISRMRAHQNSLFFENREGTQVLISVPLRSRLKQNFGSYCKAVRDETSRMSVIAKSPTGRRSITVAEYEKSLIQEVKVTAHNIANKFIESYAIRARDPDAVQFRHMQCFFVMVAAGRLILPLPETITVDKKPHGAQEGADSTHLNDALGMVCNNVILDMRADKQYSRYEKYLLEACRQISHGRHELAVVQAVMILEWFANEIIRAYLPKSIDKAFKDRHSLALHNFIVKKILNCKAQEEAQTKPKAKKNKEREAPSEQEDYLRWISLEEKLGDYFEGIGINIKSKKQNLWQRLQVLLEKRNSIIHQRSGIFVIDEANASECVESTFEIIGFCLGELKKKYAS